MLLARGSEGRGGGKGWAMKGGRGDGVGEEAISSGNWRQLNEWTEPYLLGSSMYRPIIHRQGSRTRYMSN